MIAQECYRSPRDSEGASIEDRDKGRSGSAELFLTLAGRAVRWGHRLYEDRPKTSPALQALSRALWSLILFQGGKT